MPKYCSTQDVARYNLAVVKAGERNGRLVVASGDIHYLHPGDVMYREMIQDQSNEGCSRAPNLHFRTTTEMLEAFSYLGAKKAREIVVDNPLQIAGLIEGVCPFRTSVARYDQNVRDSLTLRRNVQARAKRLYSPRLPETVRARLYEELAWIRIRRHSSHFLVAADLAIGAKEGQFPVGDYQYAGASLVAYLAGITAINPLPPHWRCSCGNSNFFTNSGMSGLELGSRYCPTCDTQMIRDGHDLPFETFDASWNNDGFDFEIPISKMTYMQSFMEHTYGKDRIIGLGIINGRNPQVVRRMAETYFEERNIKTAKTFLEKIIQNIKDVKCSPAQQSPSGVIVFDKDVDVHGLTPLQRPGNDCYSQEVIRAC